MAVPLTVAQLAAHLRLSTDPAVAPAEPLLTVLTELRNAAEEQVESYAPNAPDSMKVRAALQYCGYEYERPITQNLRNDPFRLCGALATLSRWIEFDGASTADAVTPTPATPTSADVIGGLSDDTVPTAAEFTINGNGIGVVAFPAFTDKRVLLWHPVSEGDISSVVFLADPTRENQFSAFTKHGSQIFIPPRNGNVWVSNQLLTFSVPLQVQVG